MYSRTRTKDERTTVTGSYTNSVYPSNGGTSSRKEGILTTTTDVVNNKKWSRRKRRRKAVGYNDNAFSLVRDFVEVCKINGTSPDNVKKFTNYPADGYAAPTDPLVHFPVPSANGRSAIALEIISKTNPSAPAVSLPTFAAELKEIPSLIQSWGGKHIAKTRKSLSRYATASLKKHLPALLREELQRGTSMRRAANSLARKSAEGYLVWRWVIKPTISELSTMLQFMELVDERVKTLEGLRTHGSINARCSLRTSSVETIPPTIVNLQSAGALIQAEKSQTATSKEWGSVKWTVQKSTRLPGDSVQLRKQAQRLVLGITAFEGLATAWELMPWSWLIDWFFSVGTFVKAANNTVGLTFGDICWMRHTRCSTRYKYLPERAPTYTWAKPTMPSESRERKLRIVGMTVTNPFPPVFTPFLNGKCWSVLGSLKVLKDFKGQRGLLS